MLFHLPPVRCPQIKTISGHKDAQECDFIPFKIFLWFKMEQESPFSWTKSLKDCIWFAIQRNNVNLEATKMNDRTALSIEVEI